MPPVHKLAESVRECSASKAAVDQVVACCASVIQINCVPPRIKAESAWVLEHKRALLCPSVAIAEREADFDVK
jgi:hypothetical protein